VEEAQMPVRSSSRFIGCKSDSASYLVVADVQSVIVLNASIPDLQLKPFQRYLRGAKKLKWVT